MEKTQKTTTRERGKVIIDDEAMSRYDNVVLFPEKLALAKEHLKNVKLPDFKPRE